MRLNFSQQIQQSDAIKLGVRTPSGMTWRIVRRDELLRWHKPHFIGVERTKTTRGTFALPAYLASERVQPAPAVALARAAASVRRAKRAHQKGQAELNRRRWASGRLVSTKRDVARLRAHSHVKKRRR